MTSFLSEFQNILTTWAALHIKVPNGLSDTDFLDFFSHAQDDPFFAKYKKLNNAIVELVQDYSLVNFTVLDVQDKQCMMRVMQEVRDAMRKSCQE